MRKVAFLDRDGVINKDFGYVFNWSDFVFLPNTVEALRKLVINGFDIIIVTNQSGLARGFYNVEDFHILTQKLVDYLDNQGVPILDVFFCPHYPAGIISEYSVDCMCRKPKPGMLFQAFSLYDISKADSFIVGDKESDIDCGKAAGLGSLFLISDNIFVQTNAHHTFKNLFDLTEFLFP